MTDAKESWDALGSRASSLGLKLKLHFAQARGADEAATGEGEGEGTEGAATGAAESKEARDVRDAFRRMADAIDDAFGAVGNAAKDPAVKEDVKAVGQALIEALGSTFSQVGDEVRKVVQRRSSAEGESAPWSGPPPADGAPSEPATGSAPPPPPPAEAGESGTPPA